MTVAELIAELEQFDGDAQVRLAHQPRWPFEYSIQRYEGVVEVELDEDDNGAYNGQRAQKVVYLGEGQQLGYLPHVAAVGLGWAEEQPEEYAE